MFGFQRQDTAHCFEEVKTGTREASHITSTAKSKQRTSASLLALSELSPLSYSAGPLPHLGKGVTTSWVFPHQVTIKIILLRPTCSRLSTKLAVKTNQHNGGERKVQSKSHKVPELAPMVQLFFKGWGIFSALHWKLARY